MKKKKITVEAVRKQCGFSSEFILEPQVILDNAHRIHDFLVENGGKNHVGARVILFAWASQELSISIKVFQQKFAGGMKESPAYEEMTKSEMNGMVYGICFGPLIGMLLSNFFDDDGMWLSYGMLIGMAVGMLFDSFKNKKDES